MLVLVLREIRKEKGLTQSAFAEIIGISTRGYQYAEKGNLTLSPSHYITLNAYLRGERKTVRWNGMALYRLRAEAGISVSELAVRARTTRRIVARWESGSTPSFHHMRFICSFFGKEMEYFFTEEEAAAREA